MSNGRTTMTPAQFKQHVHQLLIAVPARVLELPRRLPALFKTRGWPVETDLVAVAIAAVACIKVGAPLQRYRRPDAVDGCQDAGVPAWPREIETMTAMTIVEQLHLEELLEPPR